MIQAPKLVHKCFRTYSLRKVRYPNGKTKWPPFFKMRAIISQNKHFRRLSDHGYYIKSLMKMLWSNALLVCIFFKSDVKAQPGHTGDITAVKPSMGFSVSL